MVNTDEQRKPIISTTLAQVSLMIQSKTKTKLTESSRYQRSRKDAVNELHILTKSVVYQYTINNYSQLNGLPVHQSPSTCRRNKVHRGPTWLAIVTTTALKRFNSTYRMADFSTAK